MPQTKDPEKFLEKELNEMEEMGTIKTPDAEF